MLGELTALHDDMAAICRCLQLTVLSLDHHASCECAFAFLLAGLLGLLGSFCFGFSWGFSSGCCLLWPCAPESQHACSCFSHQNHPSPPAHARPPPSAHPEMPAPADWHFHGPSLCLFPFLGPFRPFHFLRPSPCLAPLPAPSPFLGACLCPFLAPYLFLGASPFLCSASFLDPPPFPPLRGSPSLFFVLLNPRLLRCSTLCLRRVLVALTSLGTRCI